MKKLLLFATAMALLLTVSPLSASHYPAHAVKEERSTEQTPLTYTATQTVYLGNNVLGPATLGEGWSVSNGVYTHTKGYTADLTFETAVEESAVYLLEFDTSYTANEFVRVGIGDAYRLFCYQGKSHITVPLEAVGGTTLYVTPVDSRYAGSISNITLRKIQESGTKQGLELHTVATDNHTKNYGFWNTFIGKYVAEEAVGSTRSVGIGYSALRNLQGGHRNVAVGTFTMSQMVSGEKNVAVGADSMLNVKNAEECIALGIGALYSGSSRKKEIALGEGSLKGNEDSVAQNNIGIGKYAGNAVTSAQSNVFIGNNSGYNITSGSCNTYIGDGAGKAGTTAYFNTVIGRNANHPATANNTVVIGDGAKATKSRQVVLGSDLITETVLKGDLIVRGSDGVYRQIIFNADGSCSWIAVESEE